MLVAVLREPFVPGRRNRPLLSLSGRGVPGLAARGAGSSIAAISGVARGAGRAGIANGRLRGRGRREMYWRAGGVNGGLDRHPTGLTAEYLLL